MPPARVSSNRDDPRAPLEPVRAHDPLQELLRPRLARRTEHLLGGALLEDDAAVKEAHARRDVTGKAHLVSRDQHRHPAGGELADYFKYLGNELRVERARHL